MLTIKPVKVERRRIEMMIGSVTMNIQIYQIRAKRVWWKTRTADSTADTQIRKCVKTSE